MTGEVDDVELAALMMGSATARPRSRSRPPRPRWAWPVAPTPLHRRPAGADGEPALVLEGIGLARGDRELLRGVSIRVGAGEIVGVAGISGNGQTELVGVLSGVEAPTSGSIRVAGTDITRTDVAAGCAGLGRLTEDRKGSVVPPLSVEYNLVLEDLPAYSRRGSWTGRPYAATPRR